MKYYYDSESEVWNVAPDGYKPLPTETLKTKTAFTAAKKKEAAAFEIQDKFLKDTAAWMDKAFDLVFLNKSPTKEVTEVHVIYQFWKKNNYLPPMEELATLYPLGIKFISELVEAGKIESMPTIPTA